MGRHQCSRCLADGVPIGLTPILEGILFWQCSHCEYRWHAHPSGTAEYEQADYYVKRGRDRADGNSTST